MKHVILTALAIVTIVACKNEISQSDEPAVQETPKVLQEGSDSKISLTKRSSYGSDLFEELYTALYEKDPDLRAINERLEKQVN